MKVFSRSAGSVIDTGGTVGATPSVGTSPMADSGDGLMSNPDTLRKLFAVQALQSPKQATNLSAIYKLLVPNDAATLTGAEKNKAHMFESGLRSLDILTPQTEQLRSGGPITGTLTNLFKNIAPTSPMVNPQLATFQSNIGPMRETLLNAISGANVSPKEAERVMSWIPDITKSYEENKRNLNSLKDWLNNNYEIITGSQYQSRARAPETGGWE